MIKNPMEQLVEDIRAMRDLNRKMHDKLGHARAYPYLVYSNKGKQV